jgi:uncharacterized protein YbjT (DUF2867 family)
MYSISILLIGAGGAFGQPLLQEFILRRSSLKRIAVLAANEEKATKLAATREDGVEVVVGSFRKRHLMLVRIFYSPRNTLRLAVHRTCD